MSWIREQFTFADLQRLLFKLSEHVRAFQGLTPAEISDLLGSSEKCTFGPGAHIVKEGNIGAHMYIILSGEARVLKQRPDHQFPARDRPQGLSQHHQGCLRPSARGRRAAGLAAIESSFRQKRNTAD
jgi:CRP-like cAMP-binding protein